MRYKFKYKFLTCKFLFATARKYRKFFMLNDRDKCSQCRCCRCLKVVFGPVLNVSMNSEESLIFIFLRVGNYMKKDREEAAKNVPLLFVASPSAKDPTWEARSPGTES